MKTVNGNKKLFGVCKNGTVYGNPNVPVLNLHQSMTCTKYSNMEVTRKEGYASKIMIKATHNFKLYQIINNELVQVKSDVSNKLVVLGAQANTLTTTNSVLIYNGDGTFSINQRTFIYPRDSKVTIVAVSEIYVGILDANDLPFYTDINLFDYSFTTSKITNYKIATYTNSDVERTAKNINIEINNELDVSRENALNGEYDRKTYYQTQWGPGYAIGVTFRSLHNTLTLNSMYK